MSTKPRQVREDRQGTQPWQHLHHLGAPAAAPHGPHLDAAVPLGRDEGSRALEAAAAQVAVGFQDCWRAHGHGSHKPQNPPWAMHLLPRATSITHPKPGQPHSPHNAQGHPRGQGRLTCVPRVVGQQQHSQQQGCPHSHAGPSPGPRSIPLFELGNRRSKGAREAPGSLLTALAEFATADKSGLGLGRGPGFPKPALLSPSFLGRFLQLRS